MHESDLNVDILWKYNSQEGLDEWQREDEIIKDGSGVEIKISTKM